MLKWKHIRPQNMVYQKHTLWKVEPEQYRPTSSIHSEEQDHLPGRRMGPLSITDHIGEDHWKMEGFCDIGGLKYPWPAVDREMKMSRPRFPVRPDWRIRTGFGCETMYWDSFFFFFFFQSLTHTCGYTNNFCNNQLNYHRSGIHYNLYTYSKS